MTTFDPHNNLVYGLVKTAPVPADSGLTLILDKTDYGDLFPDPAVDGEYNCTVWANNALVRKNNSTIIRIIAKSDNVGLDETTLTFTRSQESSNNRSILAGDQIAMTVTAKTIKDIETAVSTAETDIVTLEGNRVIYVAPAGSTSDWTTDVTNIQAAINSGYEVKLGEGNFYLGGKNGSSVYYLLLISRAKKISGSGIAKTILNIKSDVDNVTDVFRIAPVMGDCMLDIGGFTVKPYTTICARHAFHIDLTDSPNGAINHFNLHDIFCASCSPTWFGGSWNGNDVYLTNPTLADGMYLSRFYRNFFNQGVYLNRAGDTIEFKNNHFGGVKTGCTVASMATAGGGSSSMMIFDHNSAVIRTGVLRLTGTRFKIINNNFETVTGDVGVVTPVGVVEILGSNLASGKADFCTIMDNLITVNALDCHALYLQNCIAPSVLRNYLVGGRMGDLSRDLYIDTGCVDAKIGIEQLESPDSFYYIDQGTDTKFGLWSKVATPPILPTGAGKTVDNVITALQNIGLVTQT